MKIPKGYRQLDYGAHKRAVFVKNKWVIHYISLLPVSYKTDVYETCLFNNGYILEGEKIKYNENT